MSPKQLDEMGDLFEDIEYKTFGKDGFDDAVDQIGAIERAFGFDLAQFTAPTPLKTNSTWLIAGGALVGAAMRGVQR
jgi:hypothetical protein